jgi:hypothetical protein
MVDNNELASTMWWRVQSACQISTASISFVASSIVAIMVARSKTSSSSDGGNNNNNNNTTNRIRRNHTTTTRTTFAVMSSPYLRIIFGLSISDILQSFALLSGPLAVPGNAPQASSWAAGNSLTCTMNGGILTIVGAISSPMYTFFLCYFCLCKVKKNMTDDAFSRKIEWKLHQFIIAFNVIIFVAALVTKTLNSNARRNICSFAVIPTGCRQSPETYGECDESIARNATILSFVAYFGTALLCLVGIVTCMVKICWHIMITTTAATATTSTSTRSDIQCSESQDNDQIDGQQLHRKNLDGVEPVQRQLRVGSQMLRDDRKNAHDLVKLYRREFMIQSSLYVLAYSATCFFSWVPQIVFIIMKQRLGDVFVLFSSIFYPLGGVFNILVYTRPKVLSLRRKNPHYSWFRAFVLVVRAGGVVPMVVVKEEHIPAALPHGSVEDSFPLLRNLQSVRESRQSSSTRSMHHNLTSIDTPPGSLTNALSSGIISSDSETDKPVRVLERKFYHIPRHFSLLDSSPSSLVNTLSPADDEATTTSIGDEGRDFDVVLLSSGSMNTITEEPDEEE